MSKIDFNKHFRGIGAFAFLVGTVLFISNVLYQIFVATGDPGERFLAALPPGGWEGMLLVFVVCIAIATPLWLVYCFIAICLRSKR
jgi:hypothetical protein